jgi:hypothetical protein
MEDCIPTGLRQAPFLDVIQKTIRDVLKATHSNPLEANLFSRVASLRLGHGTPYGVRLQNNCDLVGLMLWRAVHDRMGATERDLQDVAKQTWAGSSRQHAAALIRDAVKLAVIEKLSAASSIALALDQAGAQPGRAAISRSRSASSSVGSPTPSPMISLDTSFGDDSWGPQSPSCRVHYMSPARRQLGGNATPINV